MRSFPAFVACFALLMIFWNVHYKFFRRYGLEGMTTRVVNYALLLLVLFSVYPLKFLFNAWLGGGSGIDSLADLFLVYRLYGLGLGGIWLLFGVLFWNAYRQRERLGLSPVEVILTKMDLGSVAVNVCTCAGSILLSYLPVHSWVPRVFYGTLGISMAANGMYFGRQGGAELARQRESREPRYQHA